MATCALAMCHSVCIIVYDSISDISCFPSVREISGCLLVLKFISGKDTFKVPIAYA